MALVPPNKVQGGYPLGLTGATAAARFVGATTSGAPASGTFAVGDFVIDQTGAVYVCTVAGSPGTWVNTANAAGEWDAIVRKSADESLSSDTTLQNDNELLFAITANQPYLYKLVLRFQAGGTGDIKHAFALSAGAVVASCSWRWHGGLGPTTAVAQTALVADISTVIVNAGNTVATEVVVVNGAVTGDTNANFVLQWAQNSSDATATIVKAGSYLAYRAID